MKLKIVCLQYTACILVPDGEGKTPEEIKIAEDAAAKEAIEATICANGLQPVDHFVLDPRHARDFPAAWKEQEPFVAASVTDEQFTQWAQTADGQNLNTLEIFQSIYEKPKQ